MEKLDFEQLSSQLELWSGISSCSEIHGLIAGLASVGLAFDYGKLETIVCRHLDEATCPEQAQLALAAMQKKVLDELEAADFAFSILLPEDCEDLHLRVNALSAWCQGFLVGFGTGVKSNAVSFSDEAQEVLRDMIDISNVSQSLEDEVSEEDEAAFVELEEYIRTAAMMLYSEFGVDITSSEESHAEETYH